MSDPAERLPWEGQPYSIKRHGVTITNCDSEPVQTPGCVQAHGALLVVRPADFTIRQVSENALEILGHAPPDLLEQPVARVLGEDGVARLRELIARSVERRPQWVLTLPARGDAPPLDVTAHTVDGVLILEFEATARETSADTYNYALVQSIVARLQTTGTLDAFFDLVAAELKALTGLDRVMVYRFHEDGHGEVVAEDRRPDLESWLGLHYPAEDIPRPARAIFEQIWIRPVPDVAGGLAELVPLVNPDTGRALTMTHCALRGASVMYTEYLQNMRVTAAFTLSIRREGSLYGLIACHHYSGPKYLPYQLRAACELLAQIVSLQLRAVEDRHHFTYRMKIDATHQQLVAHAAQAGEVSALVEHAPCLLDGIRAGGVALRYQDRWLRAGRTPDQPALDALASWLCERPEVLGPSAVFATDSLARLYPPAAAFAADASGLLAVPLSRADRSLIAWFRPEALQTVKWGGNPHEKPTVPGPHGPRLTPRASFELFVESVRARALPWQPVEVEAASRLRVQVLEVVMSRVEALTRLNAQLTRSNADLDAFAHVVSHDLKEPLRGIHKYAYQISEEPMPEGQRPKVDRLLALTLRMDGLLDSLLKFARSGRAALQIEDVDLNEVAHEAMEIVGWRTEQEHSAIAVPRPLPYVRADRMRCRDVYVNLLANALKYNDKPDKRIELGHVAPGEDHLRPGCPPEQSERLILYVRDNGIGIAPKLQDQVFKVFRRLHGQNEYGGGTGVGLSIVKNLVERLDGHLWLDSVPGEGTTFYFTLPRSEGV